MHVEGEPAHRQHLRRAARVRGGAELHIAAELAFDPRDQLKGVEGLGDVVVRAELQPKNFVGVLALRRDEDDGDVVLLPELQHRLDAV